MSDLDRAQYCSLATFRRDGRKVATPVWFAGSGDDFYVFSAGNAGKVKRLRNSHRAEVARCDARGGLLGDWQSAHAELIEDNASIDAALRALRRKYGWQMWLADVGARLTGRYDRRAYIRFRLTPPTP